MASTWQAGRVLGAAILALGLGHGAAIAQATDEAPSAPQMSVPDMPSSPGMGNDTAEGPAPAAPTAEGDTAAPSTSDAPSAPETAPASERTTSEQPAPATAPKQSDAGAATDGTAASDAAPNAETAETAGESAGDGTASSASPAGEDEAIDLTTVSAEATPQTTEEAVRQAADRAADFLRNGGPAIWAIAALSVVTLALILWKTWRLIRMGAWSRRHARRAVDRWEDGDRTEALNLVRRRHGMRSTLTTAAMRAALNLPEKQAREETTRVARDVLSRAQGGLRALELISTIAPLLGLLGTVMGMISAFQALQEAGNSADPSMLAGGIWEALLTTAAGMAVAIPASAALTWFEAVIGNVRQDMEDLAARIFIAQGAEPVTDETQSRMGLAAQ